MLNWDNLTFKDEELIDLSRHTPLKQQHVEPERKRQFRKLLGDGEGTQAAALRCSCASKLVVQKCTHLSCYLLLLVECLARMPV